MRKLFQITLLILIGLALSGCATVNLGIGQLRGSGNVTSETRPVAAFSAIDVSGVGEVVITQGDADSLTVTTDDGAALISERATVALSGLGGAAAAPA